MATDPSSDPAYILQLPMAKAGVKALDTVENFLTSATAPPEVYRDSKPTDDRKR